MPFGNKFILDDLSSSVLSKFQKYHPSGNLKFNNSGISRSLILRNLMEKIHRISLKLNCTPNTLGCYGLKNKTINTAETASTIKIRSRFPLTMGGFMTQLLVTTVVY